MIKNIVTQKCRLTKKIYSKIFNIKSCNFTNKYLVSISITHLICHSVKYLILIYLLFMQIYWLSGEILSYISKHIVKSKDIFSFFKLIVIGLLVCLSVSVGLSFRLLVCLSVGLLVGLPVFLSISLPVSLSVCWLDCLSVQHSLHSHYLHVSYFSILVM